MQMTRRTIVLTNGGTITYARKHKHETHILILEPSGHTYTYISPNGSITRHITLTALSKHQDLLVEALLRHNQFAWYTTKTDIYMHTCHLKPQEMSLLGNQLPRKVYWPNGTFIVKELLNISTNHFELNSLENSMRIELERNGKVVNIYSIVPVACREKRQRNQITTKLMQTFAVRLTPQTFVYPVRILLLAREAYRYGKETFDIMDIENDFEVDIRDLSSELPDNAAFHANPSFSTLIVQDELQKSSGRNSNRLEISEVYRVADLPSKRLYANVIAEYQDHVMYLLCRKQPEYGLLHNIVYVKILESQDILECQGMFIQWFPHSAPLQFKDERHRFTMDTLPPPSILPLVPSLTIQGICNHAQYLLQAMDFHDKSSVEVPITDDTASEKPDVLHNEHEFKEIERSETSDGIFRAFSNGRVRIVFKDRTIFSWDTNTNICSFFFPNGSERTVTIDSAGDLEQQYIKLATSFASWAFASTQGRISQYNDKITLQDSIANELLKINIQSRINTTQ